MATLGVMQPRPEWLASFLAGIDCMPANRTTLILTHLDVNGLAAAATLKRALSRAGRLSEVRIFGRGENPWTPGVRDEVERQKPGGLIVTDLGIRPAPIHEGTITILIDHHHPRGAPPDSIVISGYGIHPIPTSGLLAFWCAQELADVDDLLWLAALSIIGDMEEKAGFGELEAARVRYGFTYLRKAPALLNAARRSGSGIATPAFELLMKIDHPRDVLSGIYPEIQILEQARAEVTAALEMARRVAPKVKGQLALIRLDSPCQIHPLIARQWRGRLAKNIVMAANKGCRAGWVHFSIRSATGVNLIEYLRENAPVAAEENYGSGHAQATGGALTSKSWNEFIDRLGYGPEMKVEA